VISPQFLREKNTKLWGAPEKAGLFSWESQDSRRAFSTGVARSPTMEELIEELNSAERDWRLYSLRARLLTNIFRHRWFPTYGSDFQLDHKYSIRWGYLNRVPLEVISNRNNLALVRKAYNLRKGAKCSITLSELWEGYLPDPQLSQMANLVVKAEGGTLARWGLITDRWFKQGQQTIAEQASAPN
jgi:hypothetical protein